MTMTNEQFEVVAFAFTVAAVPFCVLVIVYGFYEVVWGWRKSMLVKDITVRPPAPVPTPFVYSDVEEVDALFIGSGAEQEDKAG